MSFKFRVCTVRPWLLPKEKLEAFTLWIWVLKKKYLKNEGSLNLRFSDVFNTLEPRIEITGKDYFMRNPLKQESRVLFFRNKLSLEPEV